MADTNVTRARIKSVYADNKMAFEDVFGDPFGVPEPLDGHYYHLKGRGMIAAMNNNFDDGKATRVPAKPTLLDFFVDCDRTVELALEDKDDRERFWDTYLHQTRLDAFTAKRRSEIEQKIGQLLRDHGVSPVTRYFKTIRQPSVRAKLQLERTQK